MMSARNDRELHRSMHCGIDDALYGQMLDSRHFVSVLGGATGDQLGCK